MFQIFMGFIFIFLNFTINVNYMSINLIPNFLGFILIVNGLNKLMEYSIFFQKAKPIALGLVIFETINFLINIFGLTNIFQENKYKLLEVTGFIVAITYTAISLYCSYLIVQGIITLKLKIKNPNEVDKLYSLWKISAVLQGSVYIAMIAIPVLWISIMLAVFFVNIFFLISLYKINKDFQEDIME